MTIKDVQFTDQRWLEFWDNYEGLEHQMRAVVKLGWQIKQADPCLLAENADWVEEWRSPADIENTWAGIEGAAKKHGAKYPELVAAQWALESGRGKHMSGRKNPFGLKGPGTSKQTQEVVNGKTITIQDSFIDFPSFDAAVKYLVKRWYLDWKQHKGVNHASNRNEAAKDLQRQGYATLPVYADRLIALMNQERPVQGEALPRNPLNVRWQSQNDNKSGTGYRECFSSSCAMLAMFWGKVVGDDAYNAIRAKFGDTTSAQAQLAALRSLGLRADFHTDGNPRLLEQEIDAGRPVAVGWLHKGPVSSPSGSGHWSVIIGYTDIAWIHNDPNGEASLVGGGYLNTSKGAGIAYSRKNWNPRWMPGGSGGWYLTCKP
ncbi:MAG: hypothetical protein FJ211_09245 [Ignavibacteria bacterium]|nr:hypothetical protein [Ignavibacteria bacterium]